MSFFTNGPRGFENPKTRPIIRFLHARRLSEWGGGKRAHRWEGDAVSYYAEDGKRKGAETIVKFPTQLCNTGSTN